MAKKEKKAELIDQLKEKMGRAEVMIATDYRGITVAQISELRGRFREQNIEYHVVKNTLTRRAADETGKPDLSKLLKEPTAIAFGYGDDVAQPAKILLEYQKIVKDIISIKGGLLGDRFLTKDDVVALSKLPSKDQMIAMFVGLLQSPIVRLVTVLNGNIQGLATLLQARIKQLEEGE